MHAVQHFRVFIHDPVPAVQHPTHTTDKRQKPKQKSRTLKFTITCYILDQDRLSLIDVVRAEQKHTIKVQRYSLKLLSTVHLSRGMEIDARDEDAVETAVETWNQEREMWYSNQKVEVCAEVSHVGVLGGGVAKVGNDKVCGR
jgi:hypothetical protein